MRLVLEQRAQDPHLMLGDPVYRHHELETRHRNQLGGERVAAVSQLVNHLVETRDDVQQRVGILRRAIRGARPCLLSLR